ncbi:MAG: hypothetical protein BWY05_01237 [Euryarchaeota archaeon ADurb.Bin165]|nr:MAG: hypothetical protein BWY05_01237 [Euryarchaeota archaeon ADurb.Bin165]
MASIVFTALYIAAPARPNKRNQNRGAMILSFKFSATDSKAAERVCSSFRADVSRETRREAFCALSSPDNACITSAACSSSALQAKQIFRRNGAHNR